MLRAFISFASEDAWARDCLVKQSQFRRTPWTFEDGSLQVPFNDRTWKKHTYPLIECSDVFILFIGQDTYQARGAIWEVDCARKMRKPIFGIQIKRDAPGRIPYCMTNIPIIPWDFGEILEQLERSYNWAARNVRARW